jgi:hypothetical protein
MASTSTKFACRVVGHEQVIKGELRLCKVKLRGVDTSLKVEILVGEDERVRYPYGSSALVDFSVQQTMPLEL